MHYAKSDLSDFRQRGAKEALAIVANANIRIQMRADSDDSVPMPADPYRATTAPKLWPVSGMLFKVDKPIDAKALVDAIAPKCLLAPLPVRPQLSGYLVFDDAGSEEGAPVTHVLTNGRLSALRYCTVTRNVPKAALTRAKDAAVAKATKDRGRALSSQEALLVQAHAFSDLLAGALCDERETIVLYDHQAGEVFVGERTQPAGLAAAANLDAALGKHSSRAPRFPNNPAGVMSRWLLDEQAPEGFTFGASARLQGPNKAKAAFDEHVLTSKEVTDHLRAGLEVAELRLLHEGRVAITLTQTGFVRGIELLQPVESEDLAGHSALLAAVLQYADTVLPAIRAALAALKDAEGTGERESE